MLLASLRRFGLCAVLLVSCSSNRAAAENYPARNVTIMVSFGAGTGSYVVSRMLADYLTNVFGRPFTTEARPGADGVIAATAISKEPADGYHLLVLGDATKVDMTELTPITRIGLWKYLWFLIPKDGVKVGEPKQTLTTMPEILNYLRHAPDGSLNYGASGPLTRYCSERLEQTAGIRMTYVFYPKDPAALTDLMASRIGMVCSIASISSPMVKAHELRAIAITAKVRDPDFPDVPTMAEVGLPEYGTIGAGLVLVGPPGLTHDVVDTLNKATCAFFANKDIAAKLHGMGMTPLCSSPAGAAEQMQKIFNLVKKYLP